MSMSRLFAITFVAAVAATGSALAADQWSFTEQVRQHQGIGLESRGRMEAMPTAETAIPSEASSFIVRVTESQGIDTRASEAPEMYGTVEIPFEATSFTSRVQMSQGVGEAEAEEGAAGGEPRTR